MQNITLTVESKRTNKEVLKYLQSQFNIMYYVTKGISMNDIIEVKVELMHKDMLVKEVKLYFHKDVELEEYLLGSLMESLHITKKEIKDGEQLAYLMDTYRLALDDLMLDVIQRNLDVKDKMFDKTLYTYPTEFTLNERENLKFKKVGNNKVEIKFNKGKEYQLGRKKLMNEIKNALFKFEVPNSFEVVIDGTTKYLLKDTINILNYHLIFA